MKQQKPHDIGLSETQTSSVLWHFEFNISLGSFRIVFCDNTVQMGRLGLGTTTPWLV